MGNPSVRLTFYGAAKTVTGSKYLVEAGDKSVLVDCGLFQGRKEIRALNWESPPFSAHHLSAVVLTHAHIDHSGYLPLVVKRGFRGPIYCTAATKELLNLLLIDSAYLQKEQARYHNKHGSTKHKPAKPLYSMDDARAALKQLVVIERGTPTEILPKLAVTPTCAGHILGSTSIALDWYGKRINFSGDVGRYDMPILPDPAPLELGDLLLCESTYGDRKHAENDTLDDLARVVNQAVDRKGPIIIPAFALGRTQILLYFLAQLEREGRIPVLPVFIDSPMAVDATKIHKKYRHDFDDEAQALLLEGETPLSTERCSLCKSVDQSKALNKLEGSRIVISASGMVTGGRILHHMRRWLRKEEATIVFVGYQAEGTRGRRIQSGEEEIKIFGEYIPVKAQIETISGLSAHGDYSELLRWLQGSSGSPGQIKVIHGEPNSADAFREKLVEECSWKASVAEFGETVEV